MTDRVTSPFTRQKLSELHELWYYGKTNDTFGNMILSLYDIPRVIAGVDLASEKNHIIVYTALSAMI